jgi:hypothetical protein
MYHTVRVEVDVTDIIDELDADDLKELGLTKLAERSDAPITEQIRLAAVRGDVETFIECTRQLLDEKMDVFVRTDRLLAKLREVSHATAG